MRATIDTAGRIVIPKKLRDRAGLIPGSEVEVNACEGRIEIEPVYEEPRLEWRDGFLVAVPPDGTPAMTHEEMLELIDYMRVGRLLDRLEDSER
jgi:AbrB family looped-hinge helix DNA binding protein